MPFKVWVTGEEVLAQDFNDYLQEQVIAQFPNATLRDAAIVAPNAGQMAYLADRQMLTKHDGTAWRDQAVETWFAYQPVPGAANIGTVAPGTAFPAITIPTLPAGDYEIHVDGAMLGPVAANNQLQYQIYRNTSATLLGGGAIDIRPSAPSGTSPITGYSITAISKADPGGNVTFGIVTFSTAAGSTMRAMTTTVKRVRAMN